MLPGPGSLTCKNFCHPHLKIHCCNILVEEVHHSQGRKHRSCYFKDSRGPKEPKDKHQGRFTRGDHVHVQEITQPWSVLSHSVRHLSSQEQTIKTQFYCPFAKPKPATLLSPVWDLWKHRCSTVNRCLLDSLQHCQIIWFMQPILCSC